MEMTKKSMVQVVIGGKVLTMGGYDDINIADELVTAQELIDQMEQELQEKEKELAELKQELAETEVRLEKLEGHKK